MLAPMADVLWVMLFVAVSIGMLVAARSIEPHSVSKDGRTFTCRIQELATDGRGGGRWVEAKANLVDERVVLTRRGLLRGRKEAGPPAIVVGRADRATPRFAVFLLESQGSLLALRVPARSRAVPHLDQLANG